jgi:hypothetical protein
MVVLISKHLVTNHLILNEAKNSFKEIEALLTDSTAETSYLLFISCIYMKRKSYNLRELNPNPIEVVDSKMGKLLMIKERRK